MSRLARAVEFVEMVARMQTSEEFRDGSPESDDWVATLNNLIAQARDISGIGPADDGPEVDIIANVGRT